MKSSVLVLFGVSLICAGSLARAYEDDPVMEVLKEVRAKSSRPVPVRPPPVAPPVAPPVPPPGEPGMAPEHVEKTIETHANEHASEGPEAAPNAHAEGGEHHAAGWPLKFNGFLDARYTSFVADSDPNVPNGHAESGFGIEDAKLGAIWSKARMEVVAAIALRRMKDADLGGKTTPNQSQTNNLAVGYERSEFYLRTKLSQSLALVFGQFETFFGVERNFSDDRVFNKTGLIYDTMLPVTHIGAMVEFVSDGYFAKLFAANPNNKGSYGTSTAGDENTEYGGVIGYSIPSFHIQLNYLSRPITTSDMTGLSNRTLTDAIVGTHLGKLRIDLEYAILDNPGKNTLTPAVTDHEHPGLGALVIADYELGVHWVIGARFEHIENDPGEMAKAPISQADDMGGNIRWKVNTDLSFRAEYIASNFKATSSQGWYDARSSLAALVSF